MVPANGILTPSASFARRLKIADHICVCLVLRVHAGLGSLNRQAEGVSDHDGRAGHVAEHKAHNLDVATGAGVSRHFEESKGRDATMGEKVGVAAPWFRSRYG